MIVYVGGSTGTSGPSDPYWSDVVLLLTGNGTSGSTSIPDKSIYTNTVTASGGAQTSNAQYVFNNSSIYVPASPSGSKLQIPDNAIFDLGTSFTIEFYAYALSRSAGRYFGFIRSSNDLALSTSSVSENFYYTTTGSSGNFGTGSATLLNTWRFWAIVKDSSSWQVYVDGIRVINISATGSFSSSDVLNVGNASGISPSNAFDGYLDQFRVTRNIARYSGATMTVPLAEFPTH